MWGFETREKEQKNSNTKTIDALSEFCKRVGTLTKSNTQKDKQYNKAVEAFCKQADQIKKNNASVNAQVDAQKIMKTLLEDSTFNINSFLPNYLGKMNGASDKFLLFYRLGCQAGIFTCITYMQEQLKMLFDASETVKNVLETPISLAFSTLKIISDDKIDELKLQKFVNIMQQAIVRCELLGGAVVCKGNDGNLTIADKDMGFKEEDFDYKINDTTTKIPIRSINLSHGGTTSSAKPFGLSHFEDKIFILESDNAIMRSIVELSQRMCLILMKIPVESKQGSVMGETSANVDMIDELSRQAASLGNCGVIAAPQEAELEYKSANVSLDMYWNAHYNYLMELSGGVPVSFWKAEQTAQISIGDAGGAGSVNLKFIKNKYRAHYKSAIIACASMFFGKEIKQIGYTDIDTEEAAIKYENYKKTAELLTTLSSVGVNEAEAASELASKLLSAISVDYDK